MEIRPDLRVTLDYELLDDEGTVVDSSEDGERLEFVLGAGEVPPALEEALVGRQEGDELRVELGPGEAFGEFSPDGIVSIPRSELPEELELETGAYLPLEIEHEDGTSDDMEMRIVEINPDAVVLDANHPLAGQPVTFVVKVVKVEPNE